MMSFMYHPHPYSDPRAVNPISAPEGFAEQLTARGSFHVLALVDCARARVEPLSDPARSFSLEPFDIAVAPAALGACCLVNEDVGCVVVHKTLLKGSQP